MDNDDANKQVSTEEGMMERKEGERGILILVNVFIIYILFQLFL